MISLKFFVARSARPDGVVPPLRLRHKVAMVLFGLLGVAVVVGLFLAFAVVGVVVAVPLLTAAGIGALSRKRRGRRQVVKNVRELPPSRLE
jgi:Flp pilus assembly protein TadB